MEAQQHIREWFNSGQAYAQGVQLAKAHGLDRVQLKLLESGENKFTKGKLRAALQGVLDALSSQPASSEPVAAPEPATVATEAQRPEPPELLAIKHRRIETYTLAKYHQGQMRAAAPGPERLKHAIQIKRLFRENAALFAKEAYFKQFGFLPEATAPAGLDRTDLLAVQRRRNTLRTYVTGAKKGSRGKSDPTKLAAWSAELMELDLVLLHG